MAGGHDKDVPITTELSIACSFTFKRLFSLLDGLISQMLWDCHRLNRQVVPGREKFAVSKHQLVLYHLFLVLCAPVQ